MSSHVFWIYQMSWGKAIKCEACLAFYRFFCNKFDKFNNTGAQMLDSTYHMTLPLLYNHIFVVKTLRICYLLGNIIMDVIALHYSIFKPLAVYRFYLHSIISLPDVTSCDKCCYITSRCDFMWSKNKQILVCNKYPNIVWWNFYKHSF